MFELKTVILFSKLPIVFHNSQDQERLLAENFHPDLLRLLYSFRYSPPGNYSVIENRNSFSMYSRCQTVDLDY
jgi:hypothetical protein